MSEKSTQSSNSALEKLNEVQTKHDVAQQQQQDDGENDSVVESSWLTRLATSTKGYWDKMKATVSKLQSPK